MSIIPTQNDLSFWRWPSLQDAQKQITSFMLRFTQPISPYTFATGAVTVLAIGGIIGAVAYYYIWRGSEGGSTPKRKPEEPSNFQDPNTTTTTTSAVSSATQNTNAKEMKAEKKREKDANQKGKNVCGEKSEGQTNPQPTSKKDAGTGVGISNENLVFKNLQNPKDASQKLPWFEFVAKGFGVSAKNPKDPSQTLSWLTFIGSRIQQLQSDRWGFHCRWEVENLFAFREAVLANLVFVSSVETIAKGGEIGLLVTFAENVSCLDQDGFCNLIKPLFISQDTYFWPSCNVAFQFAGNASMYSQTFLNEYIKNTSSFTPSEFFEEVTCSLKDNIHRTCIQANMRTLLGYRLLENEGSSTTKGLEFTEIDAETFDNAYKMITHRKTYGPFCMPRLESFTLDKYFKLLSFLGHYTEHERELLHECFDKRANKKLDLNSVGPIVIDAGCLKLENEEFKRAMRAFLKVYQQGKIFQIGNFTDPFWVTLPREHFEELLEKEGLQGFLKTRSFQCKDEKVEFDVSLNPYLASLQERQK